MKRNIQNKLDELIKLAEQENNPQLAGILCCVAGSLLMDDELNLLVYLREYTNNQLQKIHSINAQQN